MDEVYIQRFKKLLLELLLEGYGEINLRVVVKSSKVSHFSITKENTFQINLS